MKIKIEREEKCAQHAVHIADSKKGSKNYARRRTKKTYHVKKKSRFKQMIMA
jgi:hypothetical protein